MRRATSPDRVARAVGGAHEDGDTLDRVVKSARDEDLLFRGVESVIARAEGDVVFFWALSRRRET